MTIVLNYYVPYDELTENMYIECIAKSDLTDGCIINNALIISDLVTDLCKSKDVAIKSGERFFAIKIDYLKTIETDKEIEHSRFEKVASRKDGVNTYIII